MTHRWHSVCGMCWFVRVAWDDERIAVLLVRAPHSLAVGDACGRRGDPADRARYEQPATIRLHLRCLLAVSRTGVRDPNYSFGDGVSRVLPAAILSVGECPVLCPWSLDSTDGTAALRDGDAFDANRAS